MQGLQVFLSRQLAFSIKILGGGTGIRGDRHGVFNASVLAINTHAAEKNKLADSFIFCLSGNFRRQFRVDLPISVPPSLIQFLCIDMRYPRYMEHAVITGEVHIMP